MLKDSDRANQDLSEANVKAEALPDMKEEIKSDPEQKTIESAPNSNKMTNGETDSNKVKAEGSPTTTTITTTTKSHHKAHPNKKLKGENGAHSDGMNKMGGGPHQSMMSMSMEPPFMQQQSQIFVFSTGLANKAADMVQQGQYKSMLQYHMDQPNTKKFLQKYTKSAMIRSGQMCYSMRNPNPQMMKGQPMGGFGPNPSSSIAQWVQQQNINLEEQGMSMNMANMNSHGPFLQGSPRMMGWSPHGPNPMGPNMSMMPEFDDFGPGGPMNVNLLRSKVPNENLTPTQLQRREEHLAKIRKISQMLLPEEHRGGMIGPQQMALQQCGPGRGPGPGGPMMPDGMHPMFQQGMMSPHSMMEQSMSQSQSMMGSPQGMMSSQQQFMMSQQGMPQFGPQPQNINPAQREWMRLQEEFYNEQRQRHIQMNPNVDPNSAQGPPPSYLTSIAQKRQVGMRMGGSTSPNLNGPQMPGPSPEHDPLMFPGPGGPRHPLSPMDPTGMVPGFSSPMHPHGGGLDPNMMPNMPGKNGPPGMIPPSSMSNVKGPHVSLHRVGNPEQFQPDIPGVNSGPVGSSNSSLNSKPPPSYAQAQKRKRDDLDEIYKNLQPTPSPQQINYLNQFEGQELTITKQLNTAYRETNSAADPQLNHFQHNQVNSPMHGPNSNKGPLSNSSQTSSVGPLSSPGPMPGPSPLSGPHMSGANMRLSHYDPPSSSAPTTPTGKASMSNITSASLANLAKGVEHLSNQMQQNMMQGGPFHSIQIQNQMSNSSSQPSSQQPQQQQQPQQHPNPQHSQQQQQQQQQPQSHGQQHPPTSHPPQIPGSSIGHSQSTPSVNNTYVNATMSIQQLNIQTNNQGSQGYNPSMQVQQMNNDTHMSSSQAGPGGMPQGPGMPSGPGGMQQTSVSLSQSQMMTSMGPSMGPGTAVMNQGGPGMGPNGPSPMGPVGPSGMGPNGPSGMGPNVPSGMGPNGPSGMGPNGPSGMGPNGPAGMGPNGPAGMGPGGSAAMTSQGMGPGPGSLPMGPGKSPQFPSPNHGGITSQPSPMMSQGGPPSGRMGSPGFSNNSVGNASIQIQPKTPNTIQYLPANPPASQANTPGPKRSVEMEYMQRFAAPLTNLEGKNPTSTLQYFPTNSVPNMKLSGMGEPPFPGPQMTMQQQQQSMMMHGGNNPDFPPGMGPPDGMPPQMVSMLQQMENSGVSMGQMNKMVAMANMGPMDGPNHMSPMNNNLPPEAVLAMQGGMGPSGPGMGAMNFGPGGSMGSLSPMEMRGGMGNGHAGGQGFMPNGQSVGGGAGGMMQSHQMQMQGHGGMPGMPMQGPGMPRQPNPNSVRMPGNPNMMSGGPSQNYNAQYQQFQQQLYSQTRPRQMSPMSSMMGSPGQPYMGMMPNMP